MAGLNFSSRMLNDRALKRELGRMRRKLTRELTIPLESEAVTLGTAAQSDVPKETGDLASTAFYDVEKTKKGNVAASVGYDHEAAGAIHEGFHYGRKAKTEGRFWLQRAANGFARGFASRMAGKVSAALAKVRG